MSFENSESLEPVTLQFVRDEDVDFCGILLAKNKSIKSSSNKSRSSTHLSKVPSDRAHSRKTEATVETGGTKRNKVEPRTPKRLCRTSKTEDTFDNVDAKRNRSTSELAKFSAETPRRSSKRIQSAERKVASRSSSLFAKSPKAKRNALPSKSKILKRSEEFHDESSSSATDECSLSEAEESSEIPTGVNSRSKAKKTNSNCTSTVGKTKSNSDCVAAGLSTPKSKRQTHVKLLQTPAPVRKKIKKHFAAVSREVESDDESSNVDELEQSSDEYAPTSSESDSSENEENPDSSDSDTVPVQGRKSNLSSNILGKKKTIDVDFAYKVDADDYFLSKCSKEPTSNNQLSSLEVSHLEEDEINHLLRNEYMKHGTYSDLLIRKYKSDFTKWLFYLKENFNLLMYGLGSKIELLECFHSEILAMHDVLTIHGYFPRLLVKDILNSLIVEILKISAPKNASEALPMIESSLRSRKSPVFLIIHNVDRLISRQRKQQSIISKLASFPNLHMIMSIDHINAPLLWGNSMLTELNLVWTNTTTYQPYTNETSFENLIYLNEAGTDFVSLSSLRNIFKPLASRVKKIFRIIAKERLENANNRQYKGMSYEKWYHRAKEELLVNNITVFKVQLTELIDHGIIKTNDLLCIPILVKLDILDKFYKEMYGNEEE